MMSGCTACTSVLGMKLFAPQIGEPAQKNQQEHYYPRAIHEVDAIFVFSLNYTCEMTALKVRPDTSCGTSSFCGAIAFSPKARRPSGAGVPTRSGALATSQPVPMQPLQWSQGVLSCCSSSCN